MNRPIEATSVGMQPPADGSKDHGDKRSPRENITALVEDMLVYRANPGVTYAFFRLPGLDPSELLTRFKDEASLGLLVPAGQRMPQPLGDEAVRLADVSKLTGVVLTAGRAKEGNHRRRKVAVEFLSEYDEGERKVKAAQILILEDDSKEPVRITMRRSATVDLNSEEAGYYPGESTPVSDEQAASFLGIAKDLFEDWKKSPEGIARANRINAARTSKTHQK